MRQASAGPPEDCRSSPPSLPSRCRPQWPATTPPASRKSSSRRCRDDRWVIEARSIPPSRLPSWLPPGLGGAERGVPARRDRRLPGHRRPGAWPRPERDPGGRRLAHLAARPPSADDRPGRHERPCHQGLREAGLPAGRDAAGVPADAGRDLGRRAADGAARRRADRGGLSPRAGRPERGRGLTGSGGAPGGVGRVSALARPPARRGRRGALSGRPASARGQPGREHRQGRRLQPVEARSAVFASARIVAVAVGDDSPAHHDHAPKCGRRTPCRG